MQGNLAQMLIRARILFCALIILGLFHPAVAIEVIDSNNHKVTLSQPAKRVISMAPNLTEMLFAMGAGPSVVGVSSQSDYPPQASRLPIVNSFNQLNLEVIANLKPDLIVGFQGSRTHLFNFRALGIPVYVADFTTLNDIPKVMRDLGALTGQAKTAKYAAEKFTAQMDQLRKTYSQRAKVTVFFEVYNPPLHTVHQNSVIGEVIAICGGWNVVRTQPIFGTGSVVPITGVLFENPEVIFSGSDNDSWKQPWTTWRLSTAVRYNNLFTIPSSLIERFGPRLTEGATLMCQDLEIARTRIYQSP